MQRTRSRNQARIAKIARAIEELSNELNTLLVIEDNVSSSNTQEPNQLANVQSAVPTIFQFGQEVEITNDYNNQLGLKGIITRVTPKQVYIRLFSSNEIVRKSKKSIVHVSQPTTHG